MGLFNKQSLKDKYDKKFISELNGLKEKWQYRKNLADLSAYPNFESEIERKISEIKYFYLFKEAKIRKITAKQ